MRFGLITPLPVLLLLLLPGLQGPRFRPQDAELNQAQDAALFSQLAAADQSWRPRAERIPGVGIRYVYKRVSGDPPLTLEQIKAQLRRPPSFAAERLAIRRLLRQLRGVGVALALGPPRQTGAAGEWEPRGAVLRIRADAPGQGSREFLRVLTHEAIHVAQSCRRGSLHAEPTLLGLRRQLVPREQRQLAAPLYARSSPYTRALEEEAYANQHQPELVQQLIRIHCRG